MQKKTAAQIVKSSGWLAGCAAEFQDAVLARSDLIRLETEQSLYTAGDNSGGLFCLLTGRLDVHLIMMGNVDSLADIARPCTWIGDIAAVTGERRLLTIIAHSPCDVLRLPRSEMLRIVEQMPNAWFNIADMLAHNFTRAIAMIELLRCPEPAPRIAALLLHLSANRPHEPIGASQVEIAEMARLGRTSVQSAMVNLEQKGLIQRGYASIEIVDRAALRRFAQTTAVD